MAPGGKNVRRQINGTQYKEGISNSQCHLTVELTTL